MKGTKFQIKVWKYLKTIPKGKVKSYKLVAIGINKPKAARAVANACAKNSSFGTSLYALPPCLPLHDFSASPQSFLPPGLGPLGLSPVGQLRVAP